MKSDLLPQHPNTNHSKQIHFPIKRHQTGVRQIALLVEKREI
jgi:hypothetical protein